MLKSRLGEQSWTGNLKYRSNGWWTGLRTQLFELLHPAPWAEEGMHFARSESVENSPLHSGTPFPIRRVREDSRCRPPPRQPTCRNAGSSTIVHQLQRWTNCSIRELQTCRDTESCPLGMNYSGPTLWTLQVFAEAPSLNCNVVEVCGVYRWYWSLCNRHSKTKDVPVLPYELRRKLIISKCALVWDDHRRLENDFLC
jgi:hypothetical protein